MSKGAIIVLFLVLFASSGNCGWGSFGKALKKVGKTAWNVGKKNPDAYKELMMKTADELSLMMKPDGVKAVMDEMQRLVDESSYLERDEWETLLHCRGFTSIKSVISYLDLKAADVESM